MNYLNYLDDENEPVVVECAKCGKTDDCSDWAAPHMAHTHHEWVRKDAYGIYTGVYCDDCYQNNYPYRKDMYFDPTYAGERLEPDY